MKEVISILKLIMAMSAMAAVVIMITMMIIIAIIVMIKMMIINESNIRTMIRTKKEKMIITVSSSNDKE